ncbi:conserved hypothetical protein [Frankia sp. AiPs1]|uniref:hypothetical protein n=1 Tax=Frankia sp. AiPa1 TaxID=573492 RepID=UPI00202B9852|nr:hypothetical protein [Frankia sp. AiPa1]MCL9762833.1 hypothetical protein [Frankia sp. AiPa1]
MTTRPEGAKAGMENQQPTDGRWAPWYVYVVIIVGANLAKQKLIEDFPVVANAAITLALVGVLFLLITAVYRSISSPNRKGR